MPVVTVRVSVAVPVVITWTVLTPLLLVIALLRIMRILSFCCETISTVADKPSLRVTLAVLVAAEVVDVVVLGTAVGIVKLPDGVPEGIVLLADSAGSWLVVVEVIGWSEVIFTVTA
jgi:hypothetical protein